jgi:hypothetical protein
MNLEIVRTHTAAHPNPWRAHVPQPPDPNVEPRTPPGVPPDAPDEVDLPVDPPVDLPPRENPPGVDDPDRPRPERVQFWPGHRVVLRGRR